MFRRAGVLLTLENWSGRLRTAISGVNETNSGISQNFLKRLFHVSPQAASGRERESKYSHSVKQSEGVDAEQASVAVQAKLEGMFASPAGIPCVTLETHRMVIEGTRYDELPIVSIKATRNNTHVALTDYKGVPLTIWSCGCEGFKNAKKGTNIAAQATAMTVGQRAKNVDIKFVRVALKGLGPGRLAALKGLQLAGLEIVSITDRSPVQFGGPRPRKRRRL